MDTAEANIALGFHADERDFTPAVEILNSLKIKKVRVLTNNPDKFDVLTSSGIEVVERIALTTPRHSENEFYLNTKKNVFGHWL
jgi:GTP cyclohydrolase II